MKLKADLSVKVTPASSMAAQLGANSAKDITSTVTANDRSEKAPLVDMPSRQIIATPDCQKNAQLLASGHPLIIKFISLVTQVAETTVDYTVTLNSGVNAAVGTESDLATKVGFGGTASLDNGADKKMHVTGARLVVHYNSDDGLLSSMLLCPVERHRLETAPVRRPGTRKARAYRVLAQAPGSAWRAASRRQAIASTAARRAATASASRGRPRMARFMKPAGRMELDEPRGGNVSLQRRTRPGPRNSLQGTHRPRRRALLRVSWRKLIRLNHAALG